MALLDLLGQRWVLRIIWELRSEAIGFRELQKRCENMSSSVLARRLSELMQAGILVQTEQEAYLLTDEGQDLLANLAGLQAWADRWAEREAPKSSQT